MKIAIVGLGKMGMQIARKLCDENHDVIAYNRSPEATEQAAGYGALAVYNKEELIAAFGTDNIVLWLMIPADIVDEELDDWLALLPSGSTIIDGGNSDYRLTQKRSQIVKAKGSQLIDVGTSGGVWGYQNGFSMMVGGEAPTLSAIEPILNSLALPEGAYHHFGPSGSGHYVKMVHNAIEYGMMESLAEGYHMLKKGAYPDLDLTSAAEVWQHHSVITSWLNQLSYDVLRENPELNDVDGYVAESGEARWTLESALEYNVPMPAIQAAFDVRLASQKGTVNFATKLLAAMRNKFGGHAINKDRV